MPAERPRDESPRSARFIPQRLRGTGSARLGRTLLFAAAASAALCLGLPAEAANHQVTVRSFTFEPATLTIQAGDSVTWTNIDGPHNVRADDNSFRCANGCDDTGGNGNVAASPWSFTRTFNTAGLVLYHCQLHGGPGGDGMSGSLTVQGGGQPPGSLRFATASSTVSEGGGQVSVTVQRVGGDDGAVSVQYATSNGSATAGSDYTATSGTLNWADNDDNPKAFTVPILEDNLQESNETFNLTLSNPGGGAGLGTPSVRSVTISDNDQGGGSPGSLAFTGASFQASEGAGSASIAVSRSGGSQGAVSVQFATSDGSATAGNDYTAVSGTLSWGDGDSADKSFAVPIIDDLQGEPDETVNLTLASPGGGAGLGSPSAAVLTLFDNDSVEPGPCVGDDHTLCLQDDRFRVRVTFTPPGGTSQPATAIPFTDRAGTFWFFNPNNIEMLIKVLNACVAPFDRYWVFFSATTNVEFTVTVDDTVALQQNVYRNPQGMVALPRADTQAFDTCP